MNTKIIVALVIGIALIGLTGAASASYFDSYYPSFGSYSYPSMDYPSHSVYESYTPADTPSHSVYESYEPSVSLEVNYFGAYNGEEISGSVIDLTSPYQITESIPFGTGTFSFSAFASFWP